VIAPQTMHDDSFLNFTIIQLMSNGSSGRRVMRSATLHSRLFRKDDPAKVILIPIQMGKSPCIALQLRFFA
jgi:hypothetical protein